MAEQPATATATGATESVGVRLKRRLAEQRALLRDRFFAKPSTPKLLHDHRRLVDATLLSLWQHVEMPPELALVAVGGYGRGDLFPYSDIDLLILLPRQADDALAEIGRAHV